jgi:hypothetical protein
MQARRPVKLLGRGPERRVGIRLCMPSRAASEDDDGDDDHHDDGAKRELMGVTPCSTSM